ncbi:MAG: glycosyltransferase family 4 protein [Anaerolineae bacterium]|nr:glycosyltransferase family 4 protein [Anaerolineae bacterium]MCO5186738.1 glycosyltransferase family 4 protein [Anaerolineae bacterium]MCO5204055.1 glycosyltransferase family 4 protein [Anaerolineae bacterium]
MSNREVNVAEVNIAIVGHFPFPSGSAAAARIRNLALGLYEVGAQVSVYSMAPMLAHANDTDGELKFVKHEHMALFDLKPSAKGTVKRIQNQMRWLAGLYGSVPSTYRRLGKQFAHSNFDMLIGYGRNAAMLLPLISLCKRYNVITVLDVTELSGQFSGRGGKLNPVYWDWMVGETLMPQKFDGVITITHCLEKLYREQGCANTIVIPSIEDWSVPNESRTRTDHRPFQLTTVSSLIPRDAPEQLIGIAEHLAQRKKDFTLNIIGRYDAHAVGAQFADKIRQNPLLGQHVMLHGAVDDKHLQQLMLEADGLLLTRRNAATEVCSFPTRLVEYLKNGKPVFAADVGDIAHYLRNGVNAFLFPSGDSEAAATIIANAIDNPELTARIGRQGWLCGKECFNRHRHAERLLSFVQELYEAQTTNQVST